MNLKFELTNPVLCTSDFHIGIHSDSFLWHDINFGFGLWLKQVLTKLKIKTVFMFGDVYHNRSEISLPTLQSSYKFFNELKDFNFVILVGNHDCYYKDQTYVNSIMQLNEWPNIQIIDQPTTVQFLNNQLVFCPWGTTLDQIPDNSDIIFGHLEISSFKMGKNRICTTGFNSADLLKKAKLVMSGHFHLGEERKYENGTILYIGNPYELDWGDFAAKKGVYVLDVVTKKYHFVENTISPKHYKFYLSKILHDKKELLNADITNQIVCLVVDVKLDSDQLQQLLNVFNLLKPLELKLDYPIENTSLTDNINYDLQEHNLQDLITEFVNMLEIERKSNVLQLTLDYHKKV